MKNNYKVTTKSPVGTCLQGEFDTSFTNLVAIFGEPDDETGDDYKVSTQWCVEDEQGNVCTIYEYKETTLYSHDGYKIDEFRALPSYKWHIGGASQEIADRLISYLQEKIDSLPHTIRKVTHILNENLYQLIDEDSEFSGLYYSKRNESEVQRIVSEFYSMELDGELEDYLEERKISRIYATAIFDY